MAVLGLSIGPGYISGMNKPFSMDLPHQLGIEEAKRRMQRGTGKLSSYLPSGSTNETRWEGDRLHLLVRAMGQEVSGHMDVHADRVHLELMLPPLLAMLGGKLEKYLRKEGAAMLENKSGGSA
jgi:hypothetical protein